MPELRAISYRERLDRLGLFALDYWILQWYLIEAYQIMTHILSVAKTIYFHLHNLEYLYHCLNTSACEIFLYLEELFKYPPGQTSKLHPPQHLLAVTQLASLCSSITPVITNLNWVHSAKLPFYVYFMFKNLFSALTPTAPVRSSNPMISVPNQSLYLNDLLSFHSYWIFLQLTWHKVLDITPETYPTHFCLLTCPLKFSWPSFWSPSLTSPNMAQCQFYIMGKISSTCGISQCVWATFLNFWSFRGNMLSSKGLSEFSFSHDNIFPSCDGVWCGKEFAYDLINLFCWITWVWNVLGHLTILKM